MSILVWAAIMIVFVVAVVFVKKLPVQYALMVGPFIIALLMGYSVPETVDFFLAQFNGTMKSAGLMIVFSILYFGLLTETGFFSTVGNAVFRLTKGKMNIYVVMAMTVILTAIGMLTATIGTAYLVVFPLMLPFYERMKFDKKAALVIVTCTAAAMCFLPWGIGMAINASFANVDVMELCSKVIPITGVFIPVIVLEGIYFGIRHKKQGGIMKMELNAEELDALCNAGSDAPTRRPKMFVPNAIVFLASMATLVLGIPTYIVFMFSTLLTLLINYSDPKVAGPIVARLSGTVMGILIMLVGVSMFVGIFNGSGMVAELGTTLTAACPAFLVRYFHLILLAFAVIVCRFIPYQFYNSMLPLFASVGGSIGMNTAVVIAPFVNNLALATGSSPMTATTYIATGLLDLDVNEYAKLAVPVQTVANIIIILAGVVFGLM